MPILSWLNREQDVRLGHKVPYRLLEEVPEFSAGAEDASNLVIQGDNLEALKALLPFYAGRVKCVFIDPPYNTRSAFEHYDDNLEHSKWLGMMFPRLEMLRDLLSKTGTIWVTIDDNEAHYLKVVMDEVFGRKNFIGVAAWEKSDSPRMDAVFFSYRHDNVLCFSKNIDAAQFNKLPLASIPDHYNKVDNEGRRYYTKPLRAMGGQGDTREARPTLYYPIVAPDGTEVYPKKQDGSDGAWRWKKEKVQADFDRLEWINGRNGWTPYFRIYAADSQFRPAETIWFHNEVGTNRTSKAEIKNLDLPQRTFDTPKPEALIQRVLQIATNPGDLVLDSFLGSGTTAAVAHKMGRRYIGIEMGDHAVTHCVPRLRKVIEGESGGISEAVGWTGGGGFRFYRLGPPAFDPAGHIRSDIKFPVLAAHVWFSETGTPWRGKGKSPLLGIHNERAYALLYNGILGDKRPEHGNVLTHATLDIVKEKIAKKHPDFRGSIVVYGEMSRLAPSTLERLGIEFKQMPYDVKARA